MKNQSLKEPQIQVEEHVLEEGRILEWQYGGTDIDTQQTGPPLAWRAWGWCRMGTVVVVLYGRRNLPALGRDWEGRKNLVVKMMCQAYWK